jgi:hypothetical protein
MGQGDPGDLITKQIDLAFCCDVMKRRAAIGTAQLGRVPAESKS